MEYNYNLEREKAYLSLKGLAKKLTENETNKKAKYHAEQLY